MGTTRPDPTTRKSVHSPDDGHARAVDALRSAYAEVPAGTPVRLAKRTSNLFRFRTRGRGNGLDVSRFGRVLAVDPLARTADVQGMVTYERLVDATLPYGLMPLVVPQLKTITLGGAVAGLGIESSSFRNGLPHESVREMEVLTGDGRVVVAGPDNEHADLFHGFPNSYGTLGYALRLTIDLQPVRPFVRLRHLRFATAAACLATMADVCAAGVHAGEPVDFVDGTVFGPDEQYLTLGTFVDEAPTVSDYTGMAVYYRSIREREVDHLTVRDYLWRWDTDWFWCSRAFGVQRPLVRRLWPRRYLRSDVYRRLVALDRRYRFSASSGAPARATAGGGGGPGRRDTRRAGGGVPRRVPSRRRHRAGVAMPAAAAGIPCLAAVSIEAGAALRQPRVLVERAAGPRAARWVPQPAGGRRGHRVRRPQIAVLHRALSGRGVLAAIQRRGVPCRQGDL